MDYSGALKAGKLLWRARRSRSRLNGLPRNIAPSTVAQGYLIQAAAAKLAELPIVGYKVGLTSLRAQQLFAAESPVAGRLTSRDVRSSPLRVSVDRGHLAVVEAEVVFQLGRALPADRAPFSEEDIIASVASAFAGIEICDSRFADAENLPLPCVVADNVYADSLVIGGQLGAWDKRALDCMPVILELRSEPKIEATTAAVLGNPLRSLTWLANWLAARGESLQVGQYVASGSCTGITQAARTDLITATFGGTACVCAEFVEEVPREVWP
jgi:2-keto-4-pentenoate hydratase